MPASHNIHILKRVFVIIATSSLLLFFLVGFTVRQNENVVVTRFGQPVRVVESPGLYLKWPWPIETANRLDVRLNMYEVRLSEALTKDRHNIIVPVFVAWKVKDPLKFLQAIGTPDNAKSKLDSLVSSAKNTVLGTCDFKQLVSDDKQNGNNLTEIEEKIALIAAPQAENSFGITIEQVGIERITLPEANTGYVFDRMRAERAQFAERYLAEGRQQADAIRAETNAQRTVILAEAQKDADIKRGQGEAEAADIYTKAHSQDPDLYYFMRQLETLKNTINQNTTLVLDANQAPFTLLQSGTSELTQPAGNETKKQ
jgi:membrane protease subunit HflC